MRRRSFLGIILVLLLAIPASAQPRKPSPTQNRYLQNYGPPDLFMIDFEIEKVDTQQRIFKRLVPPRRVESWIYLHRGLRVNFDNGFFDEEQRFNSLGGVVPPTTLRPLEFTASMTPLQIETRFGRPDQIETASYGLRRVVIYRYLIPARGIKSFTFLADRLVGVVAGIAISDDQAVRAEAARLKAAMQSSPTRIGGGRGDLGTLGRTWTEIESGYGRPASWIRRGNSNVFDATWGGVRAVLTISMQGDQVRVMRRRGSDGNDCDYVGTLEADGVTVSGTYRCTRVPGTFTWRATIAR